MTIQTLLDALSFSRAAHHHYVFNNCITKMEVSRVSACVDSVQHSYAQTFFTSSALLIFIIILLIFSKNKGNL